MAEAPPDKTPDFPDLAPLRVERLRGLDRVTAMTVAFDPGEKEGPGRKRNELQVILQRRIALTYQALAVALPAAGIPELDVERWLQLNQKPSHWAHATLLKQVRDIVQSETPYRSEREFNACYR